MTECERCGAGAIYRALPSSDEIVATASPEHSPGEPNSAYYAIPAEAVELLCAICLASYEQDHPHPNIHPLKHEG